VERGVRYQRQGRVHNCEISSDGVYITADVQGSGIEPYQVEININSPELDEGPIAGSCTCPMEYNCKHVVAAFMEAFRLHPDQLAAHTQAFDEPSPQAPPPLPENLAHWLGRLHKSVQPRQETVSYSSKERQRLLYVLHLDRSNPELKLNVKLMRARLLKTGGYSPAASYSFSNPLNDVPARFILPTDIRIVRQVFLECRGYMSTEVQITGSAGTEILKAMIDTGRCHMESLDHPLLKLGEPRPAKACWRVDSKGGQHPSFEVTPPAQHLLPLNPAWYIDMEAWTAGVLQTDLSPLLVETWLAAPTVPAAKVGSVAAEFEDRFPDIALPKPQPVPVEVLPKTTPKPCLRLFTKKTQWWEASWKRTPATVLDGHDSHFVDLSFEYHGQRVKQSERQKTLESFDGTRLVRFDRDLSSEQAFETQINRIGFKRSQEASRFDTPLPLDERWTLAPGTDAKWLKFCTETLPKLRAKGWLIEFDKSFCFNVANPDEWYLDAQPQNGNDWFGVELGVKVDDQKINLLPILISLLQTHDKKFSAEVLSKWPDHKQIPIRLPDGRVLPFPAGRLRNIFSTLVELFDTAPLDHSGRLHMPKLRLAEFGAADDSEGWQWLGAETARNLAQKLKNFHGIQTLAAPAGLKATLRPYQEHGLHWLQFLRELQLAGILADDMGLGKTVQALAHLLVEQENGRLDLPSLVVAPTSLMANWRQETERFAPSLKTLVFHGLDRKQHVEKLREYNLVITSYALLPRDQALLLAHEFHYVILDEAQYIKNPKTSYAQIAGQLKARHRLCLTGTPMENHLGELWSIFNFLLPSFLGDERRFRRLFRQPIEKAKNEERRKMLARRVAPFILRRRKEEVMRELPPKTEIVQNIELAGAQRDLYESIRLAMHAKVKAEVEKKGLSRSHIIILDALLKLRQVCCDPRLVKLERAKEVKESAKLELLMDLLPEMIEEGRRILLFSQFTSMLALIQVALDEKKIPYMLLTGDTRDRETPVQKFQKGEAPLFLISLKAGGTGLNLTAADTVIHYDPWWNPAVENQATDRAHRIGQEKRVFVYKLLTIGTVEEKIAGLQAKKRELVEGLLGDGSKQRAQISVEELESLFAPLQ